MQDSKPKLSDAEINSVIAEWLGYEVIEYDSTLQELWVKLPDGRAKGFTPSRDSNALDEVKAKLREMGRPYEIKYDCWHQRYAVKINFEWAHDPNERRAFCLAVVEMIRGRDG